jgi:methionine aminotransferase
MTEHTPSLQTKLPKVGTTIFTVMSALAAEKGAVNLGQGFPDFDCDPRLIQAVTDAMQRGHNQYPPMPGVPALREAVAAKVQALYGRAYQPATEVTVTAGATQAIFTAVLACRAAQAMKSSCWSPATTAMRPTSSWPGAPCRARAADARHFPSRLFDKPCSGPDDRARGCLIVNSPHNPSATVWTRAEMLQAGRSCWLRPRCC